MENEGKKTGQNPLNLSIKQKHWLSAHGDRNETDIQYDEDGKIYVWMGNGTGEEKRVYLPDFKKEDEEK